MAQENEWTSRSEDQMSTHGELERPTEGLARELEWMAENTPALTQLERNYLRWSAAALRSARGEARDWELVEHAVQGGFAEPAFKRLRSIAAPEVRRRRR